MFNIFIYIFCIVGSIVITYFFYGIFATNIGEMIRLKRETGLTLTQQFKILFNQFQEKMKKR
ncbi:hypothetical protein IGK14_003445 [Enterococcus sp. DIV0970a]